MSWLDLVLLGGAATTLAGDVTGTTGASVVSYIRNVATPGVAPVAGQYFRASSPTVAAWAGISAADLPALAGDVTGSATANVVAGIGTGLSTVPVHATSLTWDATKTPVIGVAQSGTGAGNPIAVYGQAAKAASAAAGGDGIFGGGAGDGAGAAGKVRLRPGGSGGNDAVVCDGTTITFKSGAATLGAFTPNGALWQVVADGSSTGAGFVTSAASQRILFNASTPSSFLQFITATSFFFQDSGAGTAVSITPASSGTTSFAFASTVTSSQIGQSAGSSTGSPMLLFAQDAGGSNKTGGSFTIRSGTEAAGGTLAFPGSILFNAGTIMGQVAAFSTAQVGAVNLCNFSLGTPIVFTSTMIGAVALTISQAQRSGTGANAGGSFSITAQQGQQQAGGSANNDGGAIFLAGGAPGTGGAGAAGKPGAIHVQVNSADVITAGWDNGLNAIALSFFGATAVGKKTVSGTLTGATLAQLTTVVANILAAIGDKTTGYALVHDTTT